MQQGEMVTISTFIREYNLKKGDTGKYVKEMDIGENIGIKLHRIMINNKEYQLRREEFDQIKDEV